MSDQDVTRLPGPTKPASQPVAVAAERVVGSCEPADSPGADSPVNPLLKAHELLRGRYLLAFALAAALAAVGAFAGYSLSTPKYQSAGLLRVRSTVPTITLDQHVVLIKSPRVLDRAIRMPEWRARGLNMSAEEFGAALKVENPVRQQYIVVTFSSTDPETARVAVGAVMAAYQLVDEETDVDGQRRRQGLLDQRLTLSGNLEVSEDALSKLAPFGPAAVEHNYNIKLSELNDLRSEMRKIEITLASSGDADAKPAGKSVGPASRPAVVGAEDVARFDPETRKLLDDKRQLELSSLGLEVSLGSAHSHVRDARRKLNLLESFIAKRVERLQDEVRIAMSAAGGDGVGSRPVPDVTLSPEEQRRRWKILSPLYEGERKEAAELADLLARVRAAAAQVEADRAALKKTKGLIEELDAEERVAGPRVSVLSEADRPSAPEKDRRKMLAGAGGAGGMGFGVSLVLLMGLLNGRLRYAADASGRWSQTLPVLGVLPALPHDLPSDLETAPAAHALHKVRALLQIQSGTTGDRVFAVTSPSPGAGKTSFTVALGLSFAASGSRTLLIDCDVVGGGLSSSLAQQQSKVGLLDVLAGKPLSDCVAETGIPGLLVLSTGTSDARHASRLSPAAAHRLMEEARQKFDVVLVDTGPILGSVEASIVSSQADQVILIVSRGEQRKAAERSVEHLAAAGARVAGIVFNRARVNDGSMGDYGSDSGSYGPSRRRQPSGNGLARRLGPVAAAVQAFDN